MHKHVTHNKCYRSFNDFTEAIMAFLRHDVPKNWHLHCDAVSDNFRIISPENFQILA
jgi:hypothetical protein